MNRRKFLQALPQSQLLSRLLGRSAASLLGGLGAAHAASARDAALPGPAAGDPAGASAGAAKLPAVALYYGARIPVDDLRAFDWAVLEPAHALAQDPGIVQTLAPHTLAIAYVSLGEVQPSRPYYADIPKAWLPASNAQWGSRVIDQTAQGWPQFVQTRMIQPLWDAGFRVFFLDTLDSYQLLAHTDAARKQQADALRATLHALIQAFDGIRFLPNRGFELMDATIARATLAVAAESLYQGWDAGSQRYAPVAEGDRHWLLARFAELRAQHGLTGVAIDYVAPEQRELARHTARQIAAAGLVPWVADPTLQSLGVGTVELVPRRVLLLHSCADGDSPTLQAQSAHLYGAMPLEYWGLVPEYRYVGEAAPTQPLAGRYAGVVLWSDRAEVPESTRQLLRQARAEGVPVAILGQSEPSVLGLFGLQPSEDNLPAPLSVQRPPGAPQGEMIPLITAADTVRLQAGAGCHVWLRATGADGSSMDGAALTPWGGYALGGFGVFNLPGDAGVRWSIDPIAFFGSALRVGDAPMPDITTRTGRRAFFVHFDGDGWVNACDSPGSPLACEVLVTQFLEHYRTPTLASVIVAEVSHEGLYPATAGAAQQWARRMFALPHIEVGSHTWSHPFDWVAASEEHDRGKPTKALPYGNYLPIPNYTFSTRTEVVGARDFIQDKLCPPGKPCNMILWPGDCNPPNSAVALSYAAGMHNINGGGATLTKTQPSLCYVWPMGIPKGRDFQVYAALSNEETYTHNWQGPYFGFERALETYAMTDAPRRLKALDLYFHPFIVTKAAGLASLHKVWTWAMQQPTHPISGIQYARSVLAWRQATVARTLQGAWQLRGDADLRQWRQPQSASQPDLRASRNLAGFSTHAGMRYLHAAADEALLQSAVEDTPPAARLVDANGDITRLTTLSHGGMELELTAHVPVQATVALPSGWRLQAGSATQVHEASTPMGDMRVHHVASTETRAALRFLPEA
ncbi:MAG: endo alpha-1,4 polygalactosaminidase [Betaproteobacteria bacterium]|nr:endo alpha-1,4 polygalactosaminidase [Betaproteobacteria bacterium]